MKCQLFFSCRLMVLFACCYTGFALSQSSFWERTDAPAIGGVSDLAVLSNGDIFVVTINGEFYRSLDDGNNWAPVDLGPVEPGQTRRVVWLTINSSEHLFAATEVGSFRTGYTKGLSRSTDNGETWSPLTAPPVNSIVFNANNHIFATSNSGVHRSIDSGESWEQINNGLISPETRSIAASANGDLFLTTPFGVFRSVDNGNNWTPANANLIFLGSLAANSNGHLFAASFEGIFRSIDSGVNWTPLNAVPGSNSVLTLVVNESDHVFAGVLNNNFASLGGIHRSIDGGDTWTPINAGFPDRLPSVASIFFDSSGEVLAGTDAGIFLSMNNGDVWTQFTTADAPPSPRATRRLEINVDGHIFCQDSERLFRSTDDGRHWTVLDVGNYINALGINGDGHVFAGGDSGRVFRSTDNGDTWTQLTPGLAHSPITSIVFNSNGNVFAGTDRHGVFRSMNDGENWQPINSGLTYPFVSSLAVDSQGNLFAATAYGVFRSTDNGENWSSSSNGLADLATQILFINSNDDLFVTASNSFTGSKGLYRSTDGGDNWEALDFDLSNNSISSIAANSSNHLFATTAFGVYRSLSNGDSWEPISSAGLVSGAVVLAVNSDDYLFAGTSVGVYRSIETTTSVKEIPGVLPATFSLEQNYPNPFNPNTTIRFALRRPSFVSLKVYNTLGQEIATLATENLANGRYEVNWNAGSLASGVYLYRLQAGEFVETKKLTVSR